MGVTISASVGQGGVNKRIDVQVVQALLNRATRAGLALDGRCSPVTVAAIKAFQKGFMPNPDGRIDVDRTSWKNLIAAKEATGATNQPVPKNLRNETIIEVIDDLPETRGAGIVLCDKSGTREEIRGGPRRKWVYIGDAVMRVVDVQPPAKELPTFWERWGDSVLNCGSAAATGAVIYFSGGTTTPLVGAFALNSAALCGMSVGKAIEYDVWQEFQKEGMDQAGVNAYKVWLTTETLMSLADFCNGLKGAVGFLRGWKEAGKLEKLRKAVAGKKPTRKQLLQLIKEIDPSFNPENLKGPGFFSKRKLLIAGQEILSENKFTSLAKDKALKLVDAIGNALTLAGTKSLWFDNIPRTASVWVVEFQDHPEAE